MDFKKSLSPKHFALALLTIIIWGVNFIAIHEGLKVIPPFLLCTIRFAGAAIPWVFFIKRPKAPMKLILGYGLFTFSFQFGFLFTGIHLGLSPGLASLVLQVQVFFSMGLAAIFLKDRTTTWQVIGSLISFTGIGMVALHTDTGSTLSGLVMTLLGALSWAAGNLFSKKINADSALSMVVWGNLFALPLMILATLLMEGPGRISTAFSGITFPTIIAIIYIVYLSTHVGYGIWGFLLKRYPTATVVPLTLLIPVIGFLSAALILGEQLPMWKLLASAVVMAGLVFNLLEKKKKV